MMLETFSPDSFVWKSLRGCKVSWDHAGCQETAAEAINLIPQAIKDLIANTLFQSPVIIALQGPPHAKDIIKYYPFLMPVIKKYPKGQPPVYFIADVLMEMNRHL